MMIITDDIAKTILAGCYKFGAATLLREYVGITKVIEVYEERQKGNNTDSEYASNAV